MSRPFSIDALPRKHGVSDPLVDNVDSHEFRSLLQGLCGDSPEAVAQLVTRFRPYLRRTADEQLHGRYDVPASSAEIVVSTELHACREFGRFQGTSATEFRSWLREIVLQAVADRRRERGPAADLPGDSRGDFAPSAAELVAAQPPVGLDERLASFIRKLPPDERRVVEMRYFEGKSFVEVAAALGLTSYAARKLWMRAVVRLQALCREAS
jgi:RNA polymerase sigma-70 factor (ECF subfamily)